MALNVKIDANTTFTALLDVTDDSWFPDDTQYRVKAVINYKGLDGLCHYCPAWRERDSTESFEYQNIKYTYDPNSPTIKFHASSDEDVYPYSYTDTFCLPNKAVSLHDIPAGTYTPSAFEALIKQFISNNRNRRVENAFQVNVNGQTVSVPANSYIYYTVSSSSPNGYVRAVYFNPSPAPSSGAVPAISYCQGGTGFTRGHCYVVYIKTWSGYDYVGKFAGYARYNIRVDTGIKFI